MVTSVSDQFSNAPSGFFRQSKFRINSAISPSPTIREEKGASCSKASLRVPENLDRRAAGLDILISLRSVAMAVLSSRSFGESPTLSSELSLEFAISAKKQRRLFWCGRESSLTSRLRDVECLLNYKALSGQLILGKGLSLLRPKRNWWAGSESSRYLSINI